MNASPPRSRRINAVAIALLVLTALLPDAASAASRVCRQLEAELSGGGRTSTQARKNDAAIAKQRAQLQAAKRQARASGCGFRLFGGSSSSCAAINAKIEGLERSVASLQRKQQGPASGRSRAQIMAALRANGCRGEQTTTGGPRGLLERIFGGAARQRELVDDAPPAQQPDTARRTPANAAVGSRFSAPPGRYRTLCVRICDGYHFPLSRSSRPSDFARDEANCQTSCPGTETHIYYTRPDGEADTMVSATSGRAYTELPAAWLYKRIGVPTPEGCTCTARKSGSALGVTARDADHTAAVPPKDKVGHPSPNGRPEAGADAEVTAETPAAARQDPGDRRVRVVGPLFLPAQAGATDRQVPGRREVR